MCCLSLYESRLSIAHFDTPTYLSAASLGFLSLLTVHHNTYLEFNFDFGSALFVNRTPSLAVAKLGEMMDKDSFEKAREEFCGIKEVLSVPSDTERDLEKALELINGILQRIEV